MLPFAFLVLVTCTNLSWGLFDRQFGRSDAQEPDPEGRVPDWSKVSVQEMKDKYTALGFGPRQVSFSFYSPQEYCNRG
ncbi:hypothetical protein Hdeb2414_s0002g00055891 [Helianthus debilis subsp. tardiflorus]